MYKITQEQYNKLEKACQLAENPGECQYLHDNGKPMCVIGQLAVLENLEDLYILFGRIYMCYDDIPQFKDYPVGLLQGLQNIWDTKNITILNKDLLEFLKNNTEIVNAN